LPSFHDAIVEGAQGDGEIVEEGKADEREGEVVAPRRKNTGESIIRHKSREIVEGRDAKESLQNLERESHPVTSRDGHVAFEKS
jgi:hypothetical protein